MCMYIRSLMPIVPTVRRAIEQRQHDMILSGEAICSSSELLQKNREGMPLACMDHCCCAMDRIGQARKKGGEWKIGSVGGAEVVEQ